MSDVVIELVCGRCGQWWMRWRADLDVPFDEKRAAKSKEAVSLDVVHTQSPGSYRPATDGNWYRWAPGKAADLPEGKLWSTFRFACPNGCATNPTPRVKRLEDAAVAALRYLHDTRTPMLRTTVDKLLMLSA